MAKYVAAGLMSLAFLFLHSVSYAASLPIECRFETQLKSLETAQKNSADKDKATELALRKNILAKITDCATKDTETLKSVLSEPSSQNTDLEIKDVYAGFLSRLEDTSSYYQGQKTKIEKLDLDESKAFAKDFFDWRSKHYLPLAEKIANFIMWGKNQELIKTTERRLSQIEQTISGLELTENEDIKILLQRAKTNLQYAQASNRQARQIFVMANPPDDSLYLIRTSLEALSEIYRAFFDLGQAVKNAVLTSH